MELEEWEKHVRFSSSVSYCGYRFNSLEFVLSDRGHALACVDRDTLVQPCPKCLSVIRDSSLFVI